MAAVPQTFFEFGDFRIDPRKRLLTRRGGEPIALTPKNFDTLLYLVENAGIVLEKDRIMSAVWPRLVVEENNLNQAVSHLRRVLGDDGAEHRYILTVPRRGYHFVADVQVAVSEEARPKPASEPAAKAPSGRWRLAIGAAVVVALGMALVAWKVSSSGVPVVDTAMSSTAPLEKSIAVLPFTNLSGAREDEFLSEGMTEDMVTQLAQISGLKVISRASIMEYKDSKKPLRQVARELGVAHILQGSVRRDDQRLRINAQLIDPAREGHLWARSYDREIKDVLAVQSEVATEIAAALKTRLLDPERDQLDRRARTNPEAYVLYRKGKHLISLHKGTREDRLVARGYFERVSLLDPKSPLGYAGQAEYYYRAAMWRDDNPPKAFARALELAEMAHAADNNSAEANLVLAQIHANGYWDWARAATFTKRAVELNPGYAEAWTAYGHVLAGAGKLEDARMAHERAIALDPLNSHLVHALAFNYLDQGRCDLATRQARLYLEMNLGNFIDQVVIARCHEVAREFREAIAVYAQINRPWMPKEAVAALASAVEKANAAAASPSVVAAAYWRTRLEWQKKASVGVADQSYYVAAVASQAGERDQAFHYLNLALDRRERHVPGVKTDYQFNAIRDDPRFAAILKRLNADSASPSAR